ncbi:MAG: ester cyclase [Thermomicrobiales bacterium]
MLRLLHAALIALVLLTPGVVGHAQDATPAASPTACPATTEEQNAAIARRWLEDVINAHDLAVLDEILAPAAALDSATFAENPGPQKVLGALLTGFPDVQQTIEKVITQDDLVVIRYRSTGTHTGEFQGYAPTGKIITWTGTNIYRIECGRIADVWSEVDALGRIEQMTGEAPAGTPAP